MEVKILVISIEKNGNIRKHTEKATPVSTDHFNREEVSVL